MSLMGEEPRPLETRMASAERDIQHLSQNIDELARSNARRFDEVLTKIDSISERNRITWPLIFACIGTLGTILGVGFMVHNMSLVPLHQSIARLQLDQREHEALKAHPGALEIIGAHEEKFKTIETKVDAGIINRKDMHDKLQSEISNLSHALENGIGTRIDEKLKPLAVSVT